MTDFNAQQKALHDQIMHQASKKQVQAALARDGFDLDSVRWDTSRPGRLLAIYPRTKRNEMTKVIFKVAIDNLLHFESDHETLDADKDVVVVTLHVS